MTLTLALAFLAAAIPTFFTPGPNNLMLMASSAKFGMSRTVPHMLGVALGFPAMAFVVGLGLGEVFAAYPWLKSVLKWVAAANLLWLAWTLLGLRVGDARADERPLRFHEAALFQWINPKALAMAVSFVALVVQPGEDRLLSLLLLTAGCVAIAPLSSALWMAGGTGLKALLQRAGAERLLGPILAALMLVAVVLFLL
jgi:threonine/homoserine/homoserine lactone efflux protein